MNNTTHELLAKHQAAVKAAMAEAGRLADGLIVSLSGCDNRNEFCELDLLAAEVTIRRLRELQRTVIEQHQAVQRLTAQAMSEV